MLAGWLPLPGPAALAAPSSPRSSGCLDSLLPLAGGGLVVGEVQQQGVGVEEDAVGGGGHGGRDFARRLNLAQRQEGGVLKEGQGMEGTGDGRDRGESDKKSGVRVCREVRTQQEGMRWVPTAAGDGWGQAKVQPATAAP